MDRNPKETAFRTDAGHGAEERNDFPPLFDDLTGFKFVDGHLVALADAYATGSTADFGLSRSIPAGLTYFAQFLVHDVTFMERTRRPPEDRGEAGTTQLASTSLDLDSVYGPRDLGFPPQMDEEGFFKGIADETGRLLDLPRDRSNGKQRVLIPDLRNDENFLVARVHLLLMNVHNCVHRMSRPGTDPQVTRSIVSTLYQQVVRQDLLRQLIHPSAFAYYLEDLSEPLREPGVPSLKMPREVAVAALRFGHALPRASYRLTSEARSLVDLPTLFELTYRGAAADCMDNYSGVPFEWDQLLPRLGTKSVARAEQLCTARRASMTSMAQHDGSDIVLRNLRRGNEFPLPTAQELIDYLLAWHAPVCKRLGIERLDKSLLSSHPTLRKAIDSSGFEFDEHTPLWTYVLVEPFFQSRKFRNRRLGPLGSLLVAMTFERLLKDSPTPWGEYETDVDMPVGPAGLRELLAWDWPTLRLATLADLVEGRLASRISTL